MAQPLQYITDKNGKKKSVVLPIKKYEELLEDLQDLSILATRKNEESISHEDVIKELKQNGYL